jgi:hypothetical protein
MGWKYYLVTLIGVSAFVAAATGGFKVGTDARSPKAIKWGAWTVFVLASLIGMYLGYGLIQPKVYGAANACVVATERKVGSVKFPDNPPPAQINGIEEPKKDEEHDEQVLVARVLRETGDLNLMALGHLTKAMEDRAEALEKTLKSSKGSEPVVTPLASAQPPRPPLPAPRTVRTPSRATPSAVPAPRTSGSSEEQRARRSAEALASLKRWSASR